MRQPQAGCEVLFILSISSAFQKINAQNAKISTTVLRDFPAHRQRPRLRGGRQGSAPAPRAYAAGGRALPLHPAPARRAAGLCPAPRACAASGRALPCTRWGFTPNPEMLTHLPRLRAGRGALVPSLHAPRPSPPLWQRAGLACGCARVLSSHSALPPEPHWQNVASGVRAASSLRS